MSFKCAGRGLLIHFGFNVCDGNDTISKDIELFFEDGIDDVTEFLSGFDDDSFEEGEEATGDFEFGGAEGSFSGLFVRDSEDRDWPSTFGLLDVVFLANVIIKVQEQELYGLMIIVDVGVITAVDDGVASFFFPVGEVLDNFFVDELVDDIDGDFVWSGSDFIYTY